MKQVKVVYAFIFTMLLLISCSETEYRYIDLNTGKGINVEKDSINAFWINAETKAPLTIYYDSKTRDTLFGATGEVINNKVLRTPEGKYYYELPKPEDTIQKVKTQDEIDRELLKNGDYKKKVEKDGDVKIKKGDVKIKIDGETGEKKVKH